MMTLAAAATGQPRSWAGIIALILGYVGFRLVVFFWRKWREATPTPLSLPEGSRPKVQATVGVNTDDTDADTSWWGRIVESSGDRFRVVRQIVTTGSAALPPGGDDDEVDVALDAAPDDDPLDVDGLPASRSEELNEYVRRALAIPVPYSHIVRVAVKTYGVSESTAKRRIREVRAAEDAA